jgi:hypothetical protein
MDNLIKMGFQQGGKGVRAQEDETKIGFKAETGELFMLSKKERILLRAILSVTLDYEKARTIISKKLGKGSLAIAENLLREMGGRVE